MERYFYPRPPRGGRPDALALNTVPSKFLSTPSARRATLPQLRWAVNNTISIHALREEGDQNVADSVADMDLFLSTPSARRAT